MLNLREVAAGNLRPPQGDCSCPIADGRRPCHGSEPLYQTDPHFQNLPLFYEYFHPETGRGLGASHQTGWTALVVRCLEMLARK